jgi:hypothetical protein
MAIIVYRRHRLPPPRNHRSNVWFFVGLGLAALIVIACLSDRFNRPVTVVQPVPVQQFQPGQWNNK